MSATSDTNSLMISDYSENNIVVQANTFIRHSTGTINAIPLKMFKMIVSCIDTQNPPEDYSVYTKKQELLNFVGAKSTGAYSYLKEKLEELIRPVTLIDSQGSVTSVTLLVKFSWTPKSEYVKFEFHKDVWPYLVGLKEHFLQYNIMQIKSFKSKFSIILYENLLSYTRQTESKVFTIEMDVLRNITGTEKKYKKFKDFEANVLLPAQKEINSDPFIEYLFQYKKIKEGRTIVAIEFHLRPRTSIEDTLEYTAYPERLKNKI